MILVDSGVFLAEANPADEHYDEVNAWGRANPRAELRVPGPVVGEAAYLLQVALGPVASARFVASIAATAHVEEPHSGDYARAAELMLQYFDFPIGFVDAMVVALAERLGVTTIFTTDRRHFRAIRPAHCEAFELVP